MLDQSMNWKDAENVRKKWGKQFCLKGIMSMADAKRAIDIGATAIWCPITAGAAGRVEEPLRPARRDRRCRGDKIDVMCDGGITRAPTLKALAFGAKACSGGKLYLYALAAAGRRASKGRFQIFAPKSNAT